MDTSNPWEVDGDGDEKTLHPTRTQIEVGISIFVFFFFFLFFSLRVALEHGWPCSWNNPASRSHLSRLGFGFLPVALGTETESVPAANFPFSLLRIAWRRLPCPMSTGLWLRLHLGLLRGHQPRPPPVPADRLSLLCFSLLGSSLLLALTSHLASSFAPARRRERSRRAGRSVHGASKSERTAAVERAAMQSRQPPIVVVIPCRAGGGGPPWLGPSAWLPAGMSLVADKDPCCFGTALAQSPAGTRCHFPFGSRTLGRKGGGLAPRSRSGMTTCIRPAWHLHQAHGAHETKGLARPLAEHAEHP